MRILFCFMVFMSFPFLVRGAESVYRLDEISAGSFKYSEGLLNESVDVISSTDIEDAVASDLPGIIREKTGIVVSDFYGNGSSSASLDMRGFGAAGSSNTLVLINGQRVSGLSMAGVDWSAIPVSSVERIEIVRGAVSGVLYGDGQGGAINIITKSPISLGTSFSAQTGIGSYNGFSQKFGASMGGAAAFGRYLSTDGYRDHNELISRSAYLEAEKKFSKGTLSFFSNALSENLQLPGGVNQDNIVSSPKSASTPNDDSSRREILGNFNWTGRISENTTFLSDFFYSYQKVRGYFDYGIGQSHNDHAQHSFSVRPKISYKTKNVDILTGTEIISSFASIRYQEVGMFPSLADYSASQENISVFSQGTFSYFSAGVRGEIYHFSGKDSENSAVRESDVRTAGTVNLGVSYPLSDILTVFATGARSTRFPNIDERTGTAFSSDPLSLKPQTTMEFDAGVSIVPFRGTSLKSTFFYMKTQDEIQYDPVAYSSKNIDDVLRVGFENTVSAEKKIGPALISLSLNYIFTSAEFDSGPYKDNEVPLVPQSTFSSSVRASFWNGLLDLSASYLYTGSMYMDNDQENSFRKISGTNILNLRTGGRYKTFFWDVRMDNVTDEDYYIYAIKSLFTPGNYNAYPMPGRSYAVTAGFEF